jgi:hypothetical protein
MLVCFFAGALVCIQNNNVCYILLQKYAFSCKCLFQKSDLDYLCRMINTKYLFASIPNHKPV